MSFKHTSPNTNLNGEWNETRNTQTKHVCWVRSENEKMSSKWKLAKENVASKISLVGKSLFTELEFGARRIERFFFFCSGIFSFFTLQPISNKIKRFITFAWGQSRSAVVEA